MKTHVARQLHRFAAYDVIKSGVFRLRLYTVIDDVMSLCDRPTVILERHNNTCYIPVIFSV